MRVGLVCPYNYFRPGGVQQCVQDLANELEKRGHYVRIIAPRPKDVPQTIDPRIILLGGSREWNSFATKADVSLGSSNDKTDSLLETEKFDVMHFHEPGVPLFGMQLLSRSTAANVATLHASMPDGVVSRSYQKLMSPIARIIQTRVHAITAVSEVAEATGRVYLPNAPMTIVPNGIKLGEFVAAKNNRTSRQKTIVYIGRLEKRKGVRYLIKAYEKLRAQHADVNLVLAGDGDLRKSLEAYVIKHAIPDVQFKGFVSNDERLRLLKNATIYCSPALYGESFGIVLLEAMAMRAVTVAGNNPGYAGVMKGRGRLSLVNPMSVDDFCQRLELLIYDDELRTLWQTWADEYVKQYDFPLIVDAYEKVYKQALKAKKARTFV